MSATPLTDAHIVSGPTPWIPAEAARGIEIQLREEIQRIERELTEAKIGAARYEYLRKLNPRQFHDLVMFCNTPGIRFDAEVDRRRNAK